MNNNNLKCISSKWVYTFLFVIAFFSSVWCGTIIYPWNATTAIAKTSDNFEIWYKADAEELIESIELHGPYNTVFLDSFNIAEGYWVYDEMSGNTYNRKVFVPVPYGTLEELYDLVLNTSNGQYISQRAVKVVRVYKTDYTIFHISDTHIADESYRKSDGVPPRQKYLSALADIANIIGPEIVFLTGDNVNSRSWDEGNADYTNTWPSTQERIDYYYEGSHENGYNGVHDFNAAAFSVNGNHDHYERPADGTETKNKFEFWNKYHGIRTHHFLYGNTRFIALSNAFGEELTLQGRRHSKWLNEVGPGSLRVIYNHIYKQVPIEWLINNNIQLGLCGHNHHKGEGNPYTQGSTDMYVANFSEYTTFNLIRINEGGNFTVDNNLVAIENPKEDLSLYKPKLTLEFENSNDGTSPENLATIVNKFDVGFPGAKVRFIMPSNAYYTISKGSVDQQFDGDSVCVVDVSVPIKANSTTTVKVSKTGIPKPTLSNYSYGEHDRHVFDFWKAESDTPTPLVFVIHGGGWRGGSKERINRFVDVEQLLNAGISVAAINYRYVSQAPVSVIDPPVKAPLYDAARALQFVRSKAYELNIDKTKIAAAGGSAGACSSLWLLFHDDLADSTSSDTIAHESTRLQCAAVIGAQTTLDPKQMIAWTPNSNYGGHAFGKSSFEQFLSERESILPWIEEYSPYELVTEDDPTVCLIYSTPPALGQEQKDPTHTSNFGLMMHEKCTGVSVDCEFIYTVDKKTRHLTATEYLIENLKTQ